MNIFVSCDRKIASIFLVFCLSPAIGNAAFWSNTSGTAYYDTELDITWTTDANINGLTNLPNHQTWADGFVLEGEADWRLATLSEMSFHYNTSGITTGSPGPFINIQTGPFPADWYISSTPSGTGQWAFRFTNGNASNFTLPNIQTFSAWAVADGNVFNAIPVPAAAWLFGSALIGLSAFRRRRG